MNYKLKDLCSITKGATGIMKADGGKYPLVALSDERRSHSEFQFDEKAVIVPLISSTGHGHASMKRVHYQEGKFALGNILCAVIPNDQTRLNAKYLHLYLQQFKDSLLVPLMKGAANVSLPMNKLADVEIEVPSLERQLEIIALEEEAAGYKNELEERLAQQNQDVLKLRQALFSDAIQGKIVEQFDKDGNANDLLEKIKLLKNDLLQEKKIKVGKLQDSQLQETKLLNIPSNWAWCKLDDLCFNITDGTHQTPTYTSEGIPFLSAQHVKPFKFTPDNKKFVSYEAYLECIKNKKPETGDILITRVGAIGEAAVIDQEIDFAFYVSLGLIQPFKKFVNSKYLELVINSPYGNLYSKGNVSSKGSSAGNYNLGRLRSFLIPLPPLSEQNRIVKRLEQLMQLCDELQYSIRQSKIENEKLLQGALRDALKKEEIATA